jgi:hypothetical protein
MFMIRPQGSFNSRGNKTILILSKIKSYNINSPRVQNAWEETGHLRYFSKALKKPRTRETFQILCYLFMNKLPARFQSRQEAKRVRN